MVARRFRDSSSRLRWPRVSVAATVVPTFTRRVPVTELGFANLVSKKQLHRFAFAPEQQKIKKGSAMRVMKGIARIPGRHVRKYPVSVLLERYRQGEISLGDVARALKISLLHAQRIVNQAPKDSDYATPADHLKP